MLIKGKHVLNYLPSWVSLNPVAVVLYVKRGHPNWPLREIIAMYRDAVPRTSFIFPDEKPSKTSAFFSATARRMYGECVSYHCQFGNCFWDVHPIQGVTSGGGMPGCPCDNTDPPLIDYARGPINKEN